MYKYKQTTNVEVNDLVVWTKIPPSVTNRINNKVYKVIGESAEHGPLILNEHGKEQLYARRFGFKVLQTKPASEAVVGDYMYRITSGPDKFQQYSIIKITKLSNKYLYYDTCLSVRHDEVIVIAQADPSLVQQAPTIPESAISFALYPSGAPSEPTQPTIKEQPMNKTTLKLLLELLSASEEVKDVTNSKFVGIITNEDEYVGYMYFDSKENATECMAQPKMELHKLHLFEKSCVLAQKPRKVIEV